MREDSEKKQIRFFFNRVLGFDAKLGAFIPTRSGDFLEVKLDLIVIK